MMKKFDDFTDLVDLILGGGIFIDLKTINKKFDYLFISLVNQNMDITWTCTCKLSRDTQTLT